MLDTQALPTGRPSSSTPTALPWASSPSATPPAMTASPRCATSCDATWSAWRRTRRSRRSSIVFPRSVSASRQSCPTACSSGPSPGRARCALTLYRPAVDRSGRLMVGVAVGINGDVGGQDHEGPRVGRRRARDRHRPRSSDQDPSRRSGRPERSRPTTPIVAGNVVTPQGAADIIAAGADIVKVGVGPGAMCTTRMMTGVGRPQFSAVLECTAEARRLGKHVWADGGVRYPRDVALALAAGRGQRDVRHVVGGHVRERRRRDARQRRPALQGELRHGLASGGEEPHPRDERRSTGPRKELFEEGISTSRMYIDPDRPGVEDIIDQIVAGVRSACTYAGARSHRRVRTSGPSSASRARPATTRAARSVRTGRDSSPATAGTCDRRPGAS